MTAAVALVLQKHLDGKNHPYFLLISVILQAYEGSQSGLQNTKLCTGISDGHPATDTTCFINWINGMRTEKQISPK